MSKKYTLSKSTRQQFILHINAMDLETPREVVIKAERKSRTARQNAAMYLYFDLLAEALNNAGLDMVKVMKPGFEIPWTADSVKNCLWKPVQEAMYSTTSTTEMDTKQPSDIYKVIDKHIASKHGISVDWPSYR